MRIDWSRIRSNGIEYERTRNDEEEDLQDNQQLVLDTNEEALL